MQFCNQLFSVMLGAQCCHLSKGNVSDQVLHCIISNKSVEKNKALVQNIGTEYFQKKTSENFAL